MDYEYGYGALEDQLISLFCSGAPDFTVAENIISQGADLNAVGKYPDENMLSEIISGYCWSEYENENDNEECDNCQENRDLNHSRGETMVKIIRFFLDHGFDVQKKNGRYGAQCLWALVLSSFDTQIIEATKVLFDAGAKNMSIGESDDEDETPWDFIGTEGSYQDTCCHDHHLGNIYEAVYQMYLAVDEGRPYNKIESYEAALGKRIVRVCAEKPAAGDVFFDMNLITSQHKNCYRQTLYFMFDCGALITTQYAEIWVDSNLPNTALVDVSERFSSLVGSTIKRITFDHNEVFKENTRYGQPVTIMEMDNGVKARFSINFGEVEEADRVAYYCLMKE